MSTSTMHFGPEWMRPRGQSQSYPPPPPNNPNNNRAINDPSPPPLSATPTSPAPPGASSYSALVTPAPPEAQETRDIANPFKYSKDELLRVWKDGGGRGGLGLEVERWEGVVREVGDEPVGLKEMSDAERKLFAYPFNSELRRRQSSDVLTPSLTTNGERPKLHHGNSGVSSPMRERFGNIMSRKREPGDLPRKMSLGSVASSSRDAGGLPSPRRMGSGGGPGFEGVLNPSGDSWLAKRRAMQRTESGGSDLAGDTKDQELKEEDEDGMSGHAPSISPVPSTTTGATQSSSDSELSKSVDQIQLTDSGSSNDTISSIQMVGDNPSAAPGAPPGIVDYGAVEWTYLDPSGTVQGPFRADVMQKWFDDGYFKYTPDLLMKRTNIDKDWTPIGELVSQTIDPKNLFLAPTPPRSSVPIPEPPPVTQRVPEPIVPGAAFDLNRPNRGHTLDSYLNASPIPGSPSSFAPGGSAGTGFAQRPSPDLRGTLANDYSLRGIAPEAQAGGFGAPGRPAYRDMVTQPAFGPHSPGFPNLPSARGSTFDGYPGAPNNMNGWPTPADMRQGSMDAGAGHYGPSSIGGGVGGFGSNAMDVNSFLASSFSRHSPYQLTGSNTSSREGSLNGIPGNGAAYSANGFGAIGSGNARQSFSHQMHSSGLQQRYDAHGGPIPQNQYGQAPHLQSATGGTTSSPQSVHAQAQPAPAGSPWGRIEPSPALRRQDSLQPDIAPAPPVSASLRQKQQYPQQQPQTLWVNAQTPDGVLPTSTSNENGASAWAKASTAAAVDEGWGEARGPNSLTIENLKAHSEMHAKELDVPSDAAEPVVESPIALESAVAELTMTGMQDASALPAIITPPTVAGTILTPSAPASEEPSPAKSKRKGGAAAPSPAAPAPPAAKAPPSPIISAQPAKPVWGSSGEDVKTPGLREIQEAEAKKAETRRITERARLAAQAIATPAAEEAPAFTTSWGLPTSQAGARGPGKDGLQAISPGASPVPPAASPAGAAPVWTNAGKPASAKKTMKEIQEEEERRKKHAVKEREAAVVAAAKSRGYADTATKNTTPAPGLGGAWTTVGANGKASGAAAAAAAVVAPVRPTLAAVASTSTASVTPARTATATPSAATTRPASVLVKTPSAQSVKEDGPVAPSPDFMAWLRESLRGLTHGVNFEDIAQMLLSFPLDPDPSTVEVIAETIYASSTTLDGRRFAAEFIAKRKTDAQNRKANGAGASSGSGAGGSGKPSSIADVVKAQPKPAPNSEWGGFKVVHKKKKGARA